MVVPLRTLLYGIPLLLLGLLAALPFRHRSEATAVEDPSPVSSANRIATIEELPVSALPAWESEPDLPPADPMQSLREQFAPMADSYQAVAIPLERPAKIADRFSAVVRPSDRAASEAPSQPLVGHPAAFASRRRRPASASASAASALQAPGGWERGLPIPALPSDTCVPSQGSVAARQTPPAESAPPRPARTAEDRWPTPAELASVKRIQVGKPAIGEPASNAKVSPEAEKPAAVELPMRQPRAPADSAASGEESSATAPRQASPRPEASARPRLFIREPTG